MRRSLLFLTLLAAPLAAQSNAERIATGQDSRSHDYDLLHQRIELGEFRWEDQSFRGRVEVTLRALRPGFDSVILDAGDLLRIDSARALAAATPLPRARAVPARRAAAGPAGPALAWRHTGDTLVLRLPRPLALGDTARFVIAYHGRVLGGHGLRFFEADSFAPARPRQLWSQGEAMENHHWFPTYDFPNDPLTWELVVTAPAGMRAIGNGTLLREVTNPDGTRTAHWHMDQPAVSYLVSLVVAPLVTFTDRWKGVRVEYNVYPAQADSTRVRAAFGFTPDIIDVYSRLTGVPYPWKRYAQTTVTEHFGGMENVTATTLADWFPDGRALRDRPWYRQLLVPHELAHMWFGDWVTTANWANMWLNEGFAQFLPGQYWRVREGAAAAEDYYLDDYRNYLRQDRRRRMPLASDGSNNIYPKGSLVLQMLRAELGEERFWAGVKRYLELQHGRGATSDDFRQALLEATGENLAWFWGQWVYRAGHPDFAVAAQWDSAAAVFRLTVRQTQRDTLPADSTGLRFEVPEAFRGRVRVRVGTPAGDRVADVELTSREQVIEVPAVAAAPTFVLFDEGNRLLKTVVFPQPTAWLARQVEQQADLWGRTWAIGELAARAGDAEAEAALVRAATGAEVFTRREAVEALGGRTTPAVRAALLAALSDTAAVVRAAAAVGLGSFREGEVVAALRGAWRGDSSYAVRAAVVGALAQADSAGAPALLREALAVPSYLDQVGSAALAAIARRRDVELADAVQAAIGRLEDAPATLLALAAGGAPDPLARLLASATSPVEGIRRRVLRSLGALSPADRRAVLDLLLRRPLEPAVRQDLEAERARLGQ